jgi:uncharacterized protein YbcI
MLQPSERTTEEREREIAAALLPLLSENGFAPQGGVSAYLRGRTVTVVIDNALAPAEREMAWETEGGRLLEEWDRQISQRLRDALCALVEEQLAATVVGFHSHLIVDANQRVMVFTLDREGESPSPDSVTDNAQSEVD